jgi:hypothetical protein
VKLALPAAVGVIDASSIYTLDAMKDRLGVGDAWLREARRRGLRIRYRGRRAFVIGADLADYLRQPEDNSNA